VSAKGAALRVLRPLEQLRGLRHQCYILHNQLITRRLCIFWKFLFQFANNLPTVRDLKRAESRRIEEKSPSRFIVQSALILTVAMSVLCVVALFAVAWIMKLNKRWTCWPSRAHGKPLENGTSAVSLGLNKSTIFGRGQKWVTPPVHRCQGGLF